MAKRTKHVAARKMKSKGGKARNQLRKKAATRAAPKKAKKVAKHRAKRATKPRRSGVAARTRAGKLKQSPKPAAGAVETTIIDVIEEPVPGVVTITEFEEVSIGVTDSDEENEN